MNIYKPSGFYVYAYLRNDMSPYYIGKGRDNRLYKKGVNEIHAPTEKSKIVIIEQNLSEVGALALERRLIRWYGRKDIGTGILRNMSDGGDGCSGAKRSYETKLRISQSRIGKKFTEKHKKNISLSKTGKPGKKHTEEHKMKMSIMMGGENNPMFGKKQTEETKRKRVESRKKNSLISRA